MHDHAKLDAKLGRVYETMYETGLCMIMYARGRCYYVLQDQQQAPLLKTGAMLKSEQMQQANLQVFCSMEGVGVSLVNDRPVEVMYCTLHRYILFLSASLFPLHLSP